MSKTAQFEQDLSLPPGHASALSEYDIFLFRQGMHTRLYERLGAHLLEDGRHVHFAVWAPNAERVWVKGDFDGWVGQPLKARADQSGIWEAVLPASKGDLYKYHIESRYLGYRVDKSDPFAS